MSRSRERLARIPSTRSEPSSGAKRASSGERSEASREPKPSGLAASLPSAAYAYIPRIFVTVATRLIATM